MTATQINGIGLTVLWWQNATRRHIVKNREIMAETVGEEQVFSLCILLPTLRKSSLRIEQGAQYAGRLGYFVDQYPPLRLSVSR